MSEAKEGRIFPNFLDAYLEYADNTEASTKMHTWVGVSMIAAMLERKVWFPFGYSRLFPNMYTWIIGESGKVKKSSTAGIGMDLLRKQNYVKFLADRTTAAGLISNLSESESTYQYQGRLIKHTSAYIFAEELMSVMREVYGSIEELLIQFYDAKPDDETIPYKYKLSQQTREIFGPCLNFLGCTTPTHLRQIITPAIMEGGLTSRILFVVDKGTQSKYVSIPESVDNLLLHKAKLLQDMDAISKMTGPFKLYKAVGERHHEFYVATRKKAESVFDPRYKGYYARKDKTLLKIAMVLSASESSDMIISMNHWERAYEMLNDLEHEMFEAFGNVGRNPLAQLTFDVLNFIRSKGLDGCDKSVIVKEFLRDVSLKEIDQILTSLTLMKAIELITSYQALPRYVDASLVGPRDPLESLYKG